MRSRCYAVDSMFQPSPGGNRTGAFGYLLYPAGRPEHQTKDRQQRQDNEASHAANSFTREREYAPCQRMEYAA